MAIVILIVIFLQVGREAEIFLNGARASQARAQGWELSGGGADAGPGVGWDGPRRLIGVLTY